MQKTAVHGWQEG